MLSEKHSQFSPKLIDQTLALAGIAQAANLVERLATTGYMDSDAFETLIYSIFQLDADSTTEIYKDRSYLRTGLKQLEKLFDNQSNSRNSSAVRYMMSILHLQKQLEKRKDMLTIIGNRIEHTNRQVEMFDLTHETVITGLSGIYQDTLSTFRFRVRISGDAKFLEQKNISDKIRALLLAGVRSATLWRQVGGSRWHFISNRKKMLECAKYLAL